MSRTNEANEQQLPDLLTQHGSLGNCKARELLLCSDEQNEVLKADHVAPTNPGVQQP